MNTSLHICVPPARRLFTPALVVLLLLSLTGCEDGIAEPEPPRPGSLVVSLTHAAPDDGAVRVTLTGEGIAQVRPAGTGHTLYWRLVSPREVRIILIGQVGSGPVVTVDVADLGQLSTFRAEVVEVADRGGSVREALGSYQLSVEAIGAP